MIAGLAAKDRVPRRSALRFLGGAALVAGGAVLAACGGGGAATGGNSSSAAPGAQPGTASASSGSGGGGTLQVTGGSGKQSVAVSGGKVTMVTGAGDIFGTADTCTFFNAKATKDGSWVVKVDSVDSPSSDAKSGIMARKSLDPGSAQVGLFFFAAKKGVRFQVRPQDGGNTDGSFAVGDSSQTAPVWLKLDKKGTAWTGSWSTDGKTWKDPTPYKTAVDLGSSFLIGVAGSSHDTNTGSAVFEGFQGFDTLPSSADAISGG